MKLNFGKEQVIGAQGKFAQILDKETSLLLEELTKDVVSEEKKQKLLKLLQQEL